MITQERLKELFHYNQETGHFTRLVQTSNSVKIGDIAGSLSLGYVEMRVDTFRVKAHRLAFLYMNGEMPKNHVDHIDRNRENNSWRNLRQVTRGENQKNLPLRKDSTSGFTGVYWFKRDSNWQVQICVDGERISLGYFKEKSEAIEARKKANIKYGFHPNHGQSYPTVA